MKVTILGCGPSAGVPAIGDYWGSCDRNNPKNRRRRSSILVEENGATLLVDASPDLRQQLLDARVGRLDAILFTHAHADHTHGIDEVRPVNRAMDRAIPIYGTRPTIEEIQKRFDYIFQTPNPDAGPVFYKPSLMPNIIDGPFAVAGIAVEPFLQNHGFSASLGLRFGPVAYTTDAVGLDDSAFRVLSGVEVWIVDCYRLTPHPTHSHLAQTLDWIKRVKPRRAILTHMDSDLDYATLCRELPSGIEPAYDGLVIDI
jgi:phosphoribosyl 1,2-cyclic phosphate phosphodiesterase